MEEEDGLGEPTLEGFLQITGSFKVWVTSTSVCLNVYHQILSVRQYENKGGEPLLEFLKNERSKYPLNPESVHDSGRPV
jgi:hypothetical protein